MLHTTCWPGRDIPWKTFFARVYEGFARGAIDDVAATLTFFGILAIFPFLMFVVAVMSHVVSWATIQSLVDQLARMAPRDVTSIVSQRLTVLKSHPSTGLLTIGLIGTVLSASGGVTSLMIALNRSYDVVERRSFFRRRGIALVSTFVGGALGLAAAVVTVVVPAIASFIGGRWSVAINWLRLPTAGVLMMVALALAYTFLPDVHPRHHVVAPGAVVGVLLSLIASWGMGFYTSHVVHYEATYGTLGGVIVMLMWMWITSIAVLLGAEINRVMMPVAEIGQGAHEG